MSADSLAPEHERERQLDLVPKTPAETDLKVPAQPDEDAHDVETGDEPDMAAINRVYRKIDYRIIPPFWILYFLCAAIRSNIGLAQTMNINEGHDMGSVLNMTPHQISTSLALFYVCYVLFDLPSNLIMTRLSPRVWMSRIVMSVGLIGSCLAAARAAWAMYLLRLLLGIVIAGMWPGMSYYLTLFYPPSRTGKRIGMYYTAAQISAAVVGLVSAGFQFMDGMRGLAGFQWMFLIYGLAGILTGISLLWWLPDRPLPPGESAPPSKYPFLRWLPRPAPALSGVDAEIHYRDLKRVYSRPRWTLQNLLNVLLDWRMYPLLIMYFGVVGVGIGVQSYATMIIRSINPSLSGIQLSLLTAPIWLADLCAILLVTPLSDRFHRYRSVFFVVPACIQITGLCVTTFAPGSWARYAGLLIVGFGLGPTVPVTMTWTNEIFQRRHGEVGVAAASALVSGLGNLGSIVSTYALFSGWAEDAGRGYLGSNMVMVGMLGMSIVAAVCMQLLLRVVDGKRAGEREEEVDGAARREAEQRGFRGLFCFGGK